MLKAPALRIPGQPIGDPTPSTGTAAKKMTITFGVPAGDRLLRAPFVNGYEFSWPKVVRWGTVEYLMSLALYWAVSSLASMSTSASAAVNATGICFPHAFILLTFYSFRAADRMPHYMNPVMTGLALIHGKIGLFVAVPTMALQYAAAWTAAAIMILTGGSAIPNYSTALQPASFWGAAGLSIAVTFAFNFIMLHNASLADHLSNEGSPGPRSIELNRKDRGFTSRAWFAAGGVVVGTLIGFRQGLYTVGNAGIYFAGAWNVGFSVPDPATWTIFIFIELIGGLGAYALHLLTWNVNDLSSDDFIGFTAAQFAESTDKGAAINAAISAFAKNQ